MNNLDGELKLAVSVVQCALGDYLRAYIVSNHDQETARSWIFNSSNAKYSFNWICGTLDIDPDDVRYKLRVCPNEIRIALRKFDGSRDSRREMATRAIGADQ